MWVISYNQGPGIDAPKHIGSRLIRRGLRSEFALHSQFYDFGLYCRDALF